MKPLKHKVEQNSDEWFELRKGRITASSFSKFFMAKTTAGFQEAIATIAFERCGEDVERFAGNAMTEKGHEEEPLARQAYESFTFDDIEDGAFWTLGEWAGASPDGLIGQDGIWENKSKVTTNTLLRMLEDHEKGVYLNEQSNKAHFWQVHFQLYVTGRKWCDYQLGFSGYTPIIQRIYRDEAIIKTIEEKLAEVIKIIERKIEIIKKYKQGR